MAVTRSAANLFVACTLASGAGISAAQDYPAKPVRLITTAAGGGGDFIARLIVPGISGALGQPVVIDNRALGLLAADAVSKSPPDGYAVAMVGSSLWTVPLLRKVPYDLNDLTPVTLVERTPAVLVVHPSLPVKNVSDLIALAKSRPRELNYSSSAGVGSTSHLATELFSYMAGVKMVHIPYKGNAAALTALMSGEVQLMFSDVSIAAPHVKFARLKALAVTTAQPTPVMPGLPTIAASGLPGYESATSTGMFMPAKTPEAIINRFNQEVVRALDKADVKEKLLSAGSQAVGSTAQELATAMKSETARLGKVIREAGIKAE